jgi:hypothetical protein
MQTLMTAREVGHVAGRSRSQVVRDANLGKIEIAQRLPGKQGAMLFTEHAANSYAEARA